MCSSFKGPGFNFQHTHDSSQPSVTPVLEDPVNSSGFHGHEAHTWCTDTHVGKHIHEIFLKKNTPLFFSLLPNLPVFLLPKLVFLFENEFKL